MDRLRVLVTSVGSLVATNFLEALDDAGRARFFIIGTNSEAEAANNYACDVVYQVPPTGTGAAFRDALMEVGRREQPDLWVPARDDDVLALARLAATSPLPGRVLVGTVEAADIICDKWRSYCFARQHGLKAAPSALGLDEALRLAGEYGFPLLGKPRRGYGSRGSRFLLDQGQLQRALAHEDLLVQVPIALASDWDAPLPDFSTGVPLWYTYVDPGQYSSQWLVAPDGEVIEIGSTLSVMRSGRNERSMWADEPELSRTAGDYACALAQAGWRGPLNVQCRRSAQGEFFMFELAGRIAGGLGGRERVGIPETQMLLATLFPGRFSAPSGEPRHGVVTAKQPRTLAIDAEDMQVFRQEGVWRRSS